MNLNIIVKFYPTFLFKPVSYILLERQDRLSTGKGICFQYKICAPTALLNKAGIGEVQKNGRLLVDIVMNHAFPTGACGRWLNNGKSKDVER